MPSRPLLHRLCATGAGLAALTVLSAGCSAGNRAANEVSATEVQAGVATIPPATALAGTATPATTTSPPATVAPTTAVESPTTIESPTTLPTTTTVLPAPTARGTQSASALDRSIDSVDTALADIESALTDTDGQHHRYHHS